MSGLLSRPKTAPAGTGIVRVTSGDYDTPAELSGDVTTSGATTTIAADAVSNTKLRDSAALSVIGNSTNSTGNPGDIVAGSDNTVLRRSGTSVGFGTIPLDAITGGTNIGSGFFGNGTDGALHFDGVTTILGIAPGTAPTHGASGGTTQFYSLARDIHASSITVDTGCSIFTNGFRVFCKGAIANNGMIGCWGDDASAGTAGAGGAGSTARGANVLGGSGAGSAGTSTSTSSSAGGNSPQSTPPEFQDTAGGVGKGGKGGVNSAGTASGVAGVNSNATADKGSLNNIFQGTNGMQLLTTNRYSGGSGGSGGSGKTAPNAGGGGGGGAGGACVVVCGIVFTGTGKVVAYGGNGGAGFATSGAGGGGGGGGGWVTVVYSNGSAPTTDVTGGVGGAAGGFGTSASGGGGGAGKAYVFQVGL